MPWNEPLRLKTRVQRMRALPNAGGHTLFFWCDVSPGRGSRARGRALSLSEVPDFEGESAVFEYEKKKGRVVLGRRVEGKQIEEAVVLERENAGGRRLDR